MPLPLLDAVSDAALFLVGNEDGLGDINESPSLLPPPPPLLCRFTS